MSSTPIANDGLGYLQSCRAQVTKCLDGLSEYEVRRPMTPTGTSLLGTVKHLIGIEAGYLGLSVGRPFDEPLEWITRADAGPNDDMWAAADESREELLRLYAAAAAHSDDNLTMLPPDTPAVVPWWPEPRRHTTVAALMLRVLKDTAMHAGQAQILRELIDGQAGSDRDAIGDATWWAAHRNRLEDIARAADPGVCGS